MNKRKKSIVLGMSAILLAFGLILAGCDDSSSSSSGGGGGGSPIDGDWISAPTAGGGGNDGLRFAGGKVYNSIAPAAGATRFWDLKGDFAYTSTSTTTGTLVVTPKNTTVAETPAYNVTISGGGTQITLSGGPGAAGVLNGNAGTAYTKQ